MIKVYNWKAIVAATVLGCIVFSCQSDTKVVEPTSIDGEWEVQSATRNGRITKTVDGAIFQFDTETNQMTTDILGSEATSNYSLQGSYILQLEPKIQYEILRQTDTTIQLAMSMRGTDFTFLLTQPDTTSL